MSEATGASPVYLDANVLISFAVVDRLDLLRTAFGDACRWSTTVATEVARRAGFDERASRVRAANVLGPPVDVGMVGAVAVQELRFRMTGRSSQTRDLGEAECIHLAGLGGGLVVTDDTGAADFARHLGVPIMTTGDVLRTCFSNEAVGCPEAYDLLVRMRTEGRGVHVPPSHHHIC